MPLNSIEIYDIENRCIRVLANEIFPKISVANTRTLGRGEEPLLSTGRTQTGSGQSCPLPTLTHRLEPSDRSRFAIST